MYPASPKTRSLSLRLFLLALLALGLHPGCMVSKDAYLREQRGRLACEQRLDRCKQETEGLAGKVKNLEEAAERREKQNEQLLEELAGLQAEREEHLRKISLYKREAEERKNQIARVTDTYKNVIDHLSKEIREGKIRIDQSENRLKLNLVDKILFPSGSARLTAKGKEVLAKVGYALKDIKDRRIMIEGHTDNVPVSPKLRRRFPSNWELSAMRATAVVRYLQEHSGIDPRLLGATGYSMYRPLQSNDTPEGRQANRRIEIILSPLTPAEMQALYASPPEAGATSTTQTQGGSRARPPAK